MKGILISSLLMLTLSLGYAQLPEDALRHSWIHSSGTARQQAIGGALTALGGDISSLFINPAGLGLYKTNEFVASPGLSLLGGKSNFRGDATKFDAASRMNFGTTGMVFSYRGQNARWLSKAIAFGVNRTANFNQNIYYKGQNDYSSFAEPLANEFANSGLSIDQALNSNSLSLLTRMALYTYLVDTATVNGQTQVIARSEQASLLNQENRITSRGGITELSLGFAGNMDDKIYLGLSIGVPIVNYSRTTNWKEEDANGTGNNEFSFSRYQETSTSRGAGLNAKMGLIVKPIQRLRLGLTIHTPTLYGLRDNLEAAMTTNIDMAPGSQKEFSVNAKDFYNDQNPGFTYDLSTPWRIMLGGAFVLNEVADVTRQKGFITADIEYVSHRASRFSAATVDVPNDAYQAINAAIKDIYKRTFNFRLGGELKFNTLMVRAGFAYLGNPYNDNALKGDRMNISGGLGYRNKGFFADLTYVHSMQNDVNFPYRLEPPRLNTFAALREKTGNILLTFGVKF